MIRRNTSWLLAAGLMLGACSLAPEPVEPAIVVQGSTIEPEPHPVEAPEPEARDETTPIQRAISYLDAGREAEARSELEAILQEKPSSKTAMFMMRQIETDPVVLLGKASEPYTVKAGDTMSDLANRFLGDPLLFHALSKYNALASPQSLEVGRVLKIPAETASEKGGVEEVLVAEAAGSPVELSTDDAEKARDLRRQGLQALSAGQSQLAVQLLSAAHEIDRENDNLENDLKRALSIQKAVTSK